MAAPACVREALVLGVQKLRNAGIEGPERDARLLMAQAIEIEPGRLTLHMADQITFAQNLAFRAMIDQRIQRHPISRILGRRLFYGRWFTISDEVLDPRPDTESLVELALQDPFREVLDLGTGSGCILVTLLAENTGATGIGSDLSDRSLVVAEENATRLGVNDRLGFLQADWFKGVGGHFDLIVSNPPYIALDEIIGLAPEVINFDPRGALTDYADGLTAYRAIAADVLRFLTPGGRLLLEIGPTQAQAVTDLLTQKGLVNVTTHPDLDGRDRVISACSPNPA